MTENNTETINSDEATKAPAKKAAKKAPAKKAAAKEAPATDKVPARNLYLPALPEGFEYTSIAVTGPNGASINVSLDAGPGVEAGSARLAYEGVNLNREATFPSMSEAVKAAAKAATGMAAVAKREAELAALREEAFAL